MAIHDSVMGLIDDVFDDSEISKAVQAKIDATMLVDELVKQRIKLNKSQADIAKQLSWNSSKISRFENKADRDIKLGELAEYCGALGAGLGVTIASPVHNRAAALSACVTQIDGHLRELSKLAGECDNDKSIVEGITKFQADVLLELMTHAVRHTNDIIKRIDFVEPAELTSEIEADAQLIPA